MEKVINWFKENWFLWLFLILFYIGLRVSGYDIFILNSKDPLGIRDIPIKGKYD
jgi:hypothetical protein